jgi:hypothetical protein
MIGHTSLKGIKLNGPNALSSIKKNRSSYRPLKPVGAFRTFEFDKPPLQYRVIMMGRPSFKGTKFNESNTSRSKKKNKPSNQPLKVVKTFNDIELDKPSLQIPGHHNGTPILHGKKIKRTERFEFHKIE